MITITELRGKKTAGDKVAMLTAYDYPLARLVERAGVDMILVGDSGAMVSHGHKNTLPITMDEMVAMAKAVRRGAPDTFIVADLPFLSYQVSREQAVANAGRFVKEAGADAVKLEGGTRMADTVRAIVDAGIPVQGHIGLTPQNATQLGGYKVQGTTKQSAVALLRDAADLEKAGVFSLILETIPVPLSDYITRAFSPVTIGTGSGDVCDGQNLITPDTLGYYDESFNPRYVKRYLDLSRLIGEALTRYVAEVRGGEFPEPKHTYSLSDESFLHEAVNEWEKGEHAHPQC